ncbi:MAG: LCP family protein [Thermoleophilia bacterium]|nr:LCP family protein [Thermoleophilia bacterium]
MFLYFPVVPTSEKPYRVYRQPRRVKGDGAIQWGDVATNGTGGGPRHAGAPRRVLRFARRAVFVVLVLVVAWGLIAFLSFRGAVKDANDRLPKAAAAALAPADGPAIASSQVTMLVGADTSAYRQSKGETTGRADTLMLMRVDVPSRTVSMLSIPRDLYVDIPGHGTAKINEAYSDGGLPLAIRTVRSVTGIDVNHVAQIDFDGFKDVVDALGGITIQNPYMVRSGTCDDCAFDGKRWVFPRGKITLDGKHALAYARIRKVDERTIELNEQEGSDLGRIRRQQRVIDAIVAELASKDSVLHPRDTPKAAIAPLATDLSASEMMAMAFGKWWSKPENNLRCRLGGDFDTNSEGASIIIPSEDNRAVVRMFLGKQGPVPPDSGQSPGCVREAG